MDVLTDIKVATIPRFFFPKFIEITTIGTFNGN